MKKNGILSGAIMLSVGGVLAKIFSAVYRIVLTRILGGVGIGLYQLVFPLYSLCVVIATAGIPMAISKVISKHKDSENCVIKKCLLFTTIISFILTLLLAIFSKVLAKVQGEERIYICYLILAPTIIVVGLCSVLRGIYQGRQNFAPSALSNIVEQFVKLVLGLVLSLLLIRISVFVAIIGAMVSIAVSELFALIILLIFAKRKKQKAENKNISFKEIMRDILPITFTNSLLPIAGFVDSLLVVNLLCINFNKTDAIFMYGLESGAVGSLVGLPSIFSFAIASVILPTICRKGKNKSYQLNLAIKIVLILTLPCVLLFLFMPKQLLLLLYGKRFMNNGNGLKIASILLQISGLGVLFLSVNQVFSSTLQAVEKRRVTVRNLTIAVIAKFIVEIALMPTKFFNIYALSLGNTVCYLVVMVLNFLEIKKQINFYVSNKFKILFCNFIMLATILLFNKLCTGLIQQLLAFVIAGTIYFILLFKIDILNKTEKAVLKYKL